MSAAIKTLVVFIVALHLQGGMLVACAQSSQWMLGEDLEENHDTPQ